MEPQAPCRQLWDAAQQGNADTVRECMKNPALHQECAYRALHAACANNWPDAVNALLEGKASPDGRVKHRSAVFAAAFHGHVDVLRALLFSKAAITLTTTDYHVVGEAPIHCATRRSLGVLQCLLEARADVHEPDVYGQTPCHLAAATGRVNALKLLLAAKADVHMRDVEGRTPSFVARRWVSPGQVCVDILQLLACAKANVD
jgi:ankyrin repeat protein